MTWAGPITLFVISQVLLYSEVFSLKRKVEYLQQDKRSLEDRLRQVEKALIAAWGK